MVIIIISSVLRSITDGLENKSVSQITYYITYILIVTIVMKNFSDIINMVKTSIDNLVAFTNCLIPLLITLMITTGNIASAGMLQPIILWIISFIGNFINVVLVPASLISVALIVLTIFVGVSSLEGSITNGVDALTVKTTKAAVSNFIPIVGKILRRCSGHGYEL